MPAIEIATTEVVREALRPELEAALRHILPDLIRAATTKAYLTKPELMTLTGWSSRQVEYVKSKREIPFIRRGRTVLFPAPDVFAYLEAGRVPARRGAKG